MPDDERARAAAEKLQRTQIRIGYIQIALQLVAISATIIIALTQLDIRVDISRISKSLPGPFSISSPSNGDTVEEMTFVSGFTNLEGNHYLIASPVTGGYYVQNSEPLIIERGRYWSTVSNIGGGREGCGETFQLFVLSTDETLQIGRLEILPDDAVSTPRTTVRRAKCN